MDDEKARPQRHSGDENFDLDQHLRRKYPPPLSDDIDDIDAPPMRGVMGPGENGEAPEELRVSRPQDYRDPWNPRYGRWDRLRGAVSRWLGGG
jgi:hypothetical protein